MKQIRNAIAIILAYIMSVSPVMAAYNLSDGGEEEETSEIRQIIDLDSFGAITGAGIIPSTKHCKSGKYSAYWNQAIKPSFDISSVYTDWSGYDELCLSIYGTEAVGAKLAVIVYCTVGYFYTTVTMQEGQNDFNIKLDNFTVKSGADWSAVREVTFSSTGWGASTSPNSKFYLNRLFLRQLDSKIEKLYGYDEVHTVYNALQDGIAVWGGGKCIVYNNTQENYKNIIWKNDAVYIPIDIFEEYLGASVNVKSAGISEVSTAQKKLTVTNDSTVYTLSGQDGELPLRPFIENGELYVPGETVAKLLGYETKAEGKLLVIGTDAVRTLDSNSKPNIPMQAAAYMAYHEDVLPEQVTPQEIKLIKDRWRYAIIADENIDLTDSNIADVANKLSNKGKDSWNIMNKDNPNSLFLAEKPQTTGQMSSEYTHIYSMAVAWAMSASSLYKNNDLKNDILFALEWYYNNRYGYKEIANEGWRDYTLTNWYDWQIATPMMLVDILMLMESELTKEQITKYLSFFDFYFYSKCYNGVRSGGGMNILMTISSWLGSSLLQNDSERIIDAVESLHTSFLWAEQIKTGNDLYDGQGFRTDGSYIFHYKHPMNGHYGIQHFKEIGGLLSVISGTSIDFKDPGRENVFEWMYNAFEPLIYDGAVFRMVKARYPNGDRTVGRQFVLGMLDLLDFADGENLSRMKSLIKYYVQNEKILSYSDSSLSLVQLVKLKQILNDKGVAPRANYYISKVYNNMDKVVHQRKKWALGISMSSSRIYDYESISGENTTGWYTSDGMTQLMLADDPGQFYSNYWSNIDPYKYPGITADNRARVAQSIPTGSAFVKDFDFVGGVSLNNEYSVAAQKLNEFHLDEDVTLSNATVIKANPSTLTAQKAWFCFDNEVFCLGSGINTHDPDDDKAQVMTVVENRKSNKKTLLSSNTEVTPEYKITGVEASQVPEADNIPENTLDGDFGTKWSANGEADIVWDLGEIKNIGIVGLSFQNGNKRQQSIEIELSENGTEWKNMFKGASSGTTEGIEHFDMQNTAARYVKLISHGIVGGGAWLSLSTVHIYQQLSSGQLEIQSPEYVSGENVTVDGTELSFVPDKEQELNACKWVHLENTGGYFFPQGGKLFAKKTKGQNPFFELWLSHGESPVGQNYAYAILPTMTASETAAYAQQPDAEILVNTDKIQAVHDNSTGITGIVFWEPGNFNGITVNKPMTVIMRETEEMVELAVSDPTQKLSEAEILLEDDYQPKSLEYPMSFDSQQKKLTVDFSNSSGASVKAVLKKNTDVVQSMFIADSDGNRIFSAMSGQQVKLCADISTFASDSDIMTMTLGQYTDSTEMFDCVSSTITANNATVETDETEVLTETSYLQGYIWGDMVPQYTAVRLKTEHTADILAEGDVKIADFSVSGGADEWKGEPTTYIHSANMQSEITRDDKEYALMWCDVDGYTRLRGSAATKFDNMGKLLNGQVNIWLFSTSNSGKIIDLAILDSATGKGKYLSKTIILDWTGWRLCSVDVSKAGYQISDFDATSKSAEEADKATIYFQYNNSTPRNGEVVFVDSIYLSQCNKEIN